MDEERLVEIAQSFGRLLGVAARNIDDKNDAEIFLQSALDILELLRAVNTDFAIGVALNKVETEIVETKKEMESVYSQ